MLFETEDRSQALRTTAASEPRVVSRDASGCYVPRPVSNEKLRIPTSTYRLQFNRHFTFAQAREIVSYLHELGISDVYA